MERQGRIHRKFVEVEAGTAQGQMMFWDATLTKWVHTEVTEVFWDDTNKRLGVGTASPNAALEVGGTIVVRRVLAGGVLP